MMTLRLTLPLLLIVLIASLAVRAEPPEGIKAPATTAPSKPDKLLAPDPSLPPEQVVRIVLDALQHNDADDHGIEITFRFASPANKTVTGPIEHFKLLVKSPAYVPMINCKSIGYGVSRVEGDTAQELVTITDANGAKAAYMFQLSRQQDGEFKGCWMSDAVIRTDIRPAAPAQPGDGPIKT